VDKVLDLPLILNNYSTHKTKQVQNWLKRHKRFKLHFIPTSSSWLNLVERFFAFITEDAIRRGVFKSVAELEAAIAAYLTNHNATSKPFLLIKPDETRVPQRDPQFSNFARLSGPSAMAAADSCRGGNAVAHELIRITAQALDAHSES
jgi:hypothetical protein